MPWCPLVLLGGAAAGRKGREPGGELWPHLLPWLEPRCPGWEKALTKPAGTGTASRACFYALGTGTKRKACPPPSRTGSLRAAPKAGWALEMGWLSISDSRITCLHNTFSLGQKPLPGDLHPAPWENCQAERKGLSWTFLNGLAGSSR